MFKQFLMCLFVAGTLSAWCQQLPDSAFQAPIDMPDFPIGKGPVIMLDAAHHNFHTLNNRYLAFGNVLRADGYQLKSNDQPFSKKVLESCDILVIANALNEINDAGNWILPTPSAFTSEEIAVVKEWVSAGGSLLLIADHMPFAGANHDLAAAFGFDLLNCFALDNRHRTFERFYRGNKGLVSNPLTDGASPDARVDTVVTFTGSAFKLAKGAKPILVLGAHYTVLSPQVAWQFEEDTPFMAGENLYQMAYLQFGKGKVVLSGEAAMFTAQITGQQRFPVGFSQPQALGNIQLLRNIMKWLGSK